MTDADRDAQMGRLASLLLDVARNYVLAVGAFPAADIVGLDLTVVASFHRPTAPGDGPPAMGERGQVRSHIGLATTLAAGPLVELLAMVTRAAGAAKVGGST